MKKVAIIVVLAALVIGVSWTGVEAGSPKGSAILMEAYSGSGDVQVGNFLYETYPSVRHVSLTLGAVGADDNGWVPVFVKEGIYGWLVAAIKGQTGVLTVEFDAIEWSIGGFATSPIHAYYNWTVTYADGTVSLETIRIDELFDIPYCTV